MKLPASRPSPLRKRPDPDPPTRRPCRISIASCSAVSPISLLVLGIVPRDQAVEFSHLTQPGNGSILAFLLGHADGLSKALDVGRTLALGTGLDEIVVSHPAQGCLRWPYRSTRACSRPSRTAWFRKPDCRWCNRLACPPWCHRPPRPGFGCARPCQPQRSSRCRTPRRPPGKP